MGTRETAPSTTRRARRFATIAVAAAVAAAAVIAGLDLGVRAQQRSPLDGRPNPAPNFDVRTDRTDASATYVRRVVGDRGDARTTLALLRAGALAQLRADFSGLEIVNGRELGTPEVVGTRPGTGFLTGPAIDRAAAMRAFLASRADLYGLSAAQVGGLALIANYVNPAGNLAWVEFEQRINGLPVFHGMIRGAFTARGELVRTIGSLAPGVADVAPAVLPVVTAPDAVSRAADSVGWSVPAGSLRLTTAPGVRVTFARGPLAEETRAWLVYFPVAPGVARLAWATEIWGDPDVFLVLMDAEDGTLLFRKNLTSYQTQSATYTIYADDSPAPMSPTSALPGSGTQAAFIARSTVTLVGNEPPYSFNSLGWMTDGTTATDGNNVQAGLDRNGIDGVDAPVASANRVFTFEYDPETEEPLAGSPPINAYQSGEITDTFYWTNVYHDRLYQLGFTEAAGNFQNDNFERGGVGGDRISAEAQDSSGTDNANFTTPADGGRGRMQMYIFTGPVPGRSSGLDHDVLFHELTHGTSNRLHGNGDGLWTTMSGGMGEGWSDFYARALLATADEDPNGVYTTGGWVTYQLDGYSDNYYYGIRRFPYAVKSTVGPNGRPHNPLTFADIDATQIDTSDGAFPPNPRVFNEAFLVHNVGEVWASALFEVRARFIVRLGFAVGNQRVLQAVTDGMKLDPLNPTLLEGRDSIIAAVNASSGTAAEKAADIADVWAGFAARGMGASARVVDADFGTVVEAFDVPGISAAAGTLVTESVPNGRLDPGETVTVSLCITNQALTVSGSVTGTLAATGGVQSPSGPQSYGAIPPAGSVCREYVLTVNRTCGSMVTATLQAQETGAVTRSLTYTFQVGSNPTPFFTENFDGVVAPVLPSGWTSSLLSGTANPWTTAGSAADSTPNRVFTRDPIAVGDNALVSPDIGIPGGGGTRLDFRNMYDTEPQWSGGVLEVAIGEGQFQDIVAAGGLFVSGGYNRRLAGNTDTALRGRTAWTGFSGEFTTTSVIMPPASSGRNVRVRWWMGSTAFSGGGTTGWSVDTISFSTFQCTASSAAPPTLSSVTPATGLLGGRLAVTLAGTGFVPGLTIEAGMGIAVSDVVVTTPTTATATFTIASTAALGSQDVTVSVSGTSSAARPFTIALPSAPTLTAINPAEGAVGTAVSVTLTGTNFVSPLSLGAMSDITIGNVTVVSSTTATATLAIAPGALLGTRPVSVATIGGMSAEVLFRVLPPRPTLLSISSNAVARPSARTVALTGTNFVAGMTIGDIPGVTVTDLSIVGSTLASATFSIAGSAALGPRDVAVTTLGGTSNALTLVVADPFPDLDVTSAHAADFGVGFDEEYSVTVTNVGTVASSGTLTVTGTLPAGLTFVSGVGGGWSCGASGQLVTCANPAVLPVSASSTYTLTVTAGAAAAGSRAHTVTVSGAGDLNTVNNAGTDMTTVVASPTPAFSFDPPALAPGRQVSMGLKIPKPFPHEVTGSVTLTFTPNAVLPVNDPAIQFSEGGRTIAFTFPANSTQARFGSATADGPVPFQTGTVAGTLAFSGSSTAGTVKASFAAERSIPRLPPVIARVRFVTDAGLTAVISLFSTPRDLAELKLRFVTAPQVRANCGTTPACTADGNTLTLDVGPQFAEWFQGNPAYGGLSQLSVPLTVQGASVHGSIFFTLTNSQGASNTVSLLLP
jgi:hypothetical protein